MLSMATGLQTRNNLPLLDLFYKRMFVSHSPMPHWMVWMLHQLISRMLIFKLCQQNHTISFAVPNLALRILEKLPLFVVLCMEVNRAVLSFGSTFGHVWHILVLIHERLILIYGWEKLRKMMLLPFRNMSSFMLMMLWLSATGEKMSLENKLENISMLRRVTLNYLLFILGTIFPRLLLIMELKLCLLARLNMSKPQWQMLRSILLSMGINYHAKIPILLYQDIGLKLM